MTEVVIREKGILPYKDLQEKWLALEALIALLCSQNPLSPKPPLPTLDILSTMQTFLHLFASYIAQPSSLSSRRSKWRTSEPPVHWGLDCRQDLPLVHISISSVMGHARP